MISENQMTWTSISKPRNFYEEHVISTSWSSIAFKGNQ